MRRFVSCLTAVFMIARQTLAIAGPFEEGLESGQAATPAIRGMVNQPSAASVVPSYTASPPETVYYGQPNLPAQAGAALARCAGAVNDPVCEGQRGAAISANTARPPVGFYDPSVVAAQGVVRNPTTTLDDLSTYYGGCTTVTRATGAGTQNRMCHRYIGVGNYSCARSLNVNLTTHDTCVAGTWFAQGQAARNSLDHMYAEALCEPSRTDGLQRFRVFAAGGVGACIGWQTVDIPTAPSDEAQLVAWLSPHWEGSCWGSFGVVVAGGSGCVGTSCNYTFKFGIVDASNPAGVLGWTLPLSFTKPGLAYDEHDSFDDQCAILTAGGRCQVASADVCVEGRETRRVGPINVTRDCWRYERTLTCDGGAPLDECAPLAASGCTPVSSVCRQPVGGLPACEIYEDTYQCPVAPGTSTVASGCPTNVACIGSICFDTSYANDTDFARAMSIMEAGREAGVYLDTTNMVVFKGENNSCRERLLKNCCDSDSSGAGMTNQSVFGTGSRLVYDLLMDSGNRDFLYQGMNALLTSQGMGASTFSSYGVTVASVGEGATAAATAATLEAQGSVVLLEGESLVLAFNPWTLVVAVVIMVVLALSTCNEQEGRLSMKQGAGLCHEVGSYCSQRVLGACIEHRTSKCCFNSKLARIIQEQGRVQIGKGWGAPEGPDCSGFTIPQLQALDFGAMDFSEFYASIVPVLPDAGRIQTNNASRVPSCYYGQGKC